MLNITITPTAIYFKDLEDDIYKNLTQKMHLELQEPENSKGHYIKDEPKKLYKILVNLSYTYDIELT